MSPESRARGYRPGRFTLTSEEDDVAWKEMDSFELQCISAGVYVTCDQCEGKRYNRETLKSNSKKNIAEILDMTVEDALHFFENMPLIAKM